ncbi:MAG: DUF6046 domain-containing protein [Leptospirales bacterium]|nr:DUF6046 domain-containing protein [Leptospirales bacterium]
MFDALSAVGDMLTFAGGTSIPHPLSLLTKDVYPLEIGGYEFIDGALVQVSGSKNIQITELPGGKNSVKELVGMNDYRIEIASKIVCQNNTELLNELKNIIALWNTSDSLEIICPYTEAFGIKKIAIQDFSPIIRDGFQSVLWYTISGYSDNEIDRQTEINQSRFAKLQKYIGGIASTVLAGATVIKNR